MPHSLDPYNGIQIQSDALGTDEIHFGKSLQYSLQKWQSDGRKGVWLAVPLEKTYFLPILVELGFQTYHCDERRIVLNKWLPKGPSSLPRGPSHLVGVGGFVVNEKNQLLVVKEKHGPVTDVWKLPGGLVDPGEELHEAAIREVREETGIETTFSSLLSVSTRHQAKHSIPTADLYFICLLRPLSAEIVRQEAEIAEARWMDVEEFLGIGFYKGLYQRMLGLGGMAVKEEYQGWEFEKSSSGHFQFSVYHGAKL
uniref:Nudix hydrolase domain-containing protein n=1 Tax=Arcella intermedia TaxID=1963864 RepID=A0A6B2LEJ9_9EUKA